MTTKDFQTTRINIALILMLLCLTACQQKSEIDKCVEAMTLSYCVSYPTTPGKEKNPASDRNDCIKEITESDGAKFRLQCLRAQAGKE